MKKHKPPVDGLTIIGANPETMLESPFDEYQVKKRKDVVWWQKTPAEILILLVIGAMDVALIFKSLDLILVELKLVLYICVAGASLIAILLPVMLVGPPLFRRYPDKLPTGKAILGAVITLGLLFVALLAIRYVAVGLYGEDSLEADLQAKKIAAFFFFLLQGAAGVISSVFGYYIARNHALRQLHDAELEAVRLEVLISQTEACITELENTDELIDRAAQGETRKKAAILREVDAIKNRYMDHTRLRIAAAVAKTPPQTSYLTSSRPTEAGETEA